MNRSEIRETAIERRDTLSKSLNDFITAAGKSLAEASQYYQNNQTSRVNLQTRLEKYNKDLSKHYHDSQQALHALNTAINTTPPNADKINKLIIDYSRNIGDVQSDALDIVTAVHNANFEESGVVRNMKRNDELLNSFNKIAETLSAMLKENATNLDPQTLQAYQEEIEIHRKIKDNVVNVYADVLNQNASVAILNEAGEQYTDMIERLKEVGERLQQAIGEAKVLPETPAEKSDDQIPIPSVVIAAPTAARSAKDFSIPEPESVHTDETRAEPSTPSESDDELDSASSSVGTLTPSTPSPISTPFMSPRATHMPANTARAEELSANTVLKEVSKTNNMDSKQKIMLKGVQDFLQRFTVEKAAGSDVQTKVAKIEAEILGKLLQKIISTLEKYDRKGNADNIGKLNDALTQIQERISEIEGKKPGQQPTSPKLG